ncbi:MAG: AAA family ATPase, partial [Gemmatimonadota bacterium]
MRLITLGVPRLMDGEERIDVGPVKQLALLAYLTCQEGKPVRRAMLADLLWREATEGRAQRSLSQALYDLRRRVPRLELQSTRHDLQLFLRWLSVDVLDLKACLAAEDADAALSLFNGRFLEGFEVAGNPPFHEWRDAYAAGIESALLELLEKEHTRCRSAGDWGRAERMASAILDLRPFDDTMAIAQLEAAAMVGDQSRVLTMLEARNETWRCEFGEPLVDDAASRHLLLPFEADENDAAIVEPPFVGRAEEFGQLVAAWKDAEAGRQRNVLVIGQGGIGKSRLCEQLLRYAAVRGGNVLTACCYAAERRVALNPLAEALKTCLAPEDTACLPPVWRTVLESHFPDLASEPPESRDDVQLMREAPVPRRLQEAVARLFITLSERQPVVLFLDDIHWADESTTAVLHYLSRIEGPHRIMLMAALRPDDIADSSAHALLSDRDDKTYWNAIEIGEMDKHDVEKLIEKYAAKLNISADARFVHDVYEMAGGLPLFVVQVMRTGWRGRLQGPAAGAHDGSDLPEGLERFVREQLRRLNPDARRVLSCMAVVGVPMDADRLIWLSGMGGTDFSQALERLESEGVVYERAGGLSVAHGVIRDIVSSLVPASTARRLHHRIARMFESDGQHGPAAVHYEMASDRKATRRVALAAARQSEKVLAFEEALYFLKMARSVTSDRQSMAAIDEDIVRILLRERWYSEADRYLEKLNAYYQDCAAGTDDSLRITVEKALVRLHQGAVPVESSVKELKRLLGQARSKEDSTLAVKLLRALGMVASEAHLVELGVSVAKELVDRAATMTDPRVAVGAYSVGVLLIAYFDSVELGMQLLGGLKTFEQSAESPFVTGAISRCRAQVLQQTGDLTSAAREYQRVASIAEKYALGPTWQSVGNNMAVLEMERGRYQRAIGLLSEVERYGLAREEHEVLPSVLYNLAICHWETDVYSECTRVAKQLRSIQEEMAVESRRHEAWSMLGLVALHLGNVTEAKNCEREILLWEGATPSWYGDTSYREMFLARL